MRKKHRHKRITRTPEQVALTCKTAKEAEFMGIEVHRAYLQQQFGNLDTDSKFLLQTVFEAMAQNPNQSKEIMEIVKNAKSKEDLLEVLNLINNNGGNNNGEKESVQVATNGPVDDIIDHSPSNQETTEG